MKKTKLLTISIIGLLFLNLGTLLFLVTNEKRDVRHPHNKSNPRKLIIEKLHFDEAQQKEYDNLITWHRTEIDKNEQKIRETKNNLYALLSQKKMDAKRKDSLIACVGEFQKQIEASHYQHFEDIKRICHQDQLNDFNALTKELSKIFGRNKALRPRHD